MKAAPFEYSRPADLDEACAWLAADESARVIAGGQTLVPMMVMRLARPTRLIDINRIAALSYIRAERRRRRHRRHHAAMRGRARRTNRHAGAAAGARIPNIGHAATRARGTIGGSLANADPAAELALIAITLDAVLELPRRWRHRRNPGARILHRPDDHDAAGRSHPLRRAVSGLAAAIGVGFHEVNARRSDFAFVSAAAQVELGDDGNAKRIAIGIGAATDFPMRLESAEQQLTARRSMTRRWTRRCARRSPISMRWTTCTPPPITAAAPRSISPRAPSPMRWPMRKRQSPRSHMRIELDINGTLHEVEVEPRTTLLDCLRDIARPQRRACRLRARRLRRLHRAVRRRGGALLPDVRGAGGRARRSPPSRASRPAPASCRRSRTPSARPTACNAAIARRP